MTSPEVPPEVPFGLFERGRRMWEQTVEVWSLSPAHLVLLEEACRVADRLELLDMMLRRAFGAMTGDQAEDGADSSGFAEVPGLMAESRAQQTVLKGLLLELRQGQRAPGGRAAAPPAEQSTSGGSGVSDLSARIAERRAQASR